jgi:hypothetical protein
MTNTREHYRVRLYGLGPSRWIVRGVTQQVARYDTRAEAQAIADKCPALYAAAVVLWDGE